MALRASGQRSGGNQVGPQPLRQAAAATIERLEPRMLLSLTAAQVVYNWKHAHPGFLHDLAVYEYEHPAFAARQNADLQRLGLPAITPIAPTLTASATSSARGTHHPKPHKPAHPKPLHPKPPHHTPRHHVRGDGPMIKDNPGPSGPTVTAATFSYSFLPQTVTFTFSEDVSASINAAQGSAFTLTNTSTQTDYSSLGTITADSSSQTATVSFGSQPLPAGQYVLKLISAKITDSGGAALVGNDPSDSDYSFTFYYIQGDFDGNGVVDSADESVLATHYNESTSYRDGDANYDGTTNAADFTILAANYDTSVILGTPRFASNPVTSVNSALVSWSDIDPTVTSFTVTRTNADGSDPTIVANGVSSTSIQDTGLTAGTNYIYSIYGRNNYAYQTVLGTTLSVTLPAASAAPAGYSLTPPQPPTGLSAPAGGSNTGDSSDNSITIKWSPSPSSNVTQYEVDRDGVNIGGVTAVPGQDQYSLIDDHVLIPNSTHNYTVTALDGSYTKSTPATVQGSTGPDVTPPSVPDSPDSSPAFGPSGLNGLMHPDGSLTLSWRPAGDNVGVDHYEVYEDYIDKASTLLGTTAGDSYTWNTGTLAQDVRGFDVVAVDAAGNKSKNINFLGGFYELPAYFIEQPPSPVSPVDYAPYQYVPSSYVDYFYNVLVKAFYQLFNYYYNGIPDGYAPSFNSWLGTQTPILAESSGIGQTAPISGNLQDGTWYLDLNGNQAQDPGEQSVPSPLLIQGTPVLFNAPEGAGYSVWNYQTDPVWMDNAGTGVYEPGDQILYDPKDQPPTAGTIGCPGVNVYDLGGGRSLLWSDATALSNYWWAEPSSDFGSQFQLLYQAIDTMVGGFPDPSTAGSSSPKSWGLGGVMDAAGVGMVDGGDGLISVDADGTATISDVSFPYTIEQNDRIQIGDQWYTIGAATLTASNPTIKLGSGVPAMPPQPLRIRNWTLIPDQTATSNTPAFSRLRGDPGEMSSTPDGVGSVAVFREQFVELEGVLKELAVAMPEVIAATHASRGTLPTIDWGTVPSDVIPLTTAADYFNTVPDTNLDGIVQVPFSDQPSGNDTGLIQFEADKSMPQVYLPIYTDTSGALPIHAYLTQGGFGDSTAAPPKIGDLRAGSSRSEADGVEWMLNSWGDRR